MSDGIIAIGNPGAGKSTLLNALAGEILFKSGVSFGGGLTYQLDEKSNGNGHFIDTPGLADEELRKKAGEAISEVLKRGGRYQVLFFVRERSGRVIVEDVTTMKIVLKAAPEIGSDYGIIVNQVPDAIIEGLNVEKNKNEFFRRLHSGIGESYRCSSSRVFLLREIEELTNKKNKLIGLSRLGKFRRFVQDLTPQVQLTRGRASDVDAGRFDEMRAKIAKAEEELERSRAAKRKLQERVKREADEQRRERNRLRDVREAERKAQLRQHAREERERDQRYWVSERESEAEWEQRRFGPLPWYYELMRR